MQSLRLLIRSRLVRSKTTALVGLAGIYDLPSLVDECRDLLPTPLGLIAN